MVNDFKFVPLATTGDEIKESPFSRIAIIFGYAENEHVLKEMIRKTVNRELYDIH